MNFTARIPEQVRSLGRYPIPVAACVVLTIYLNLCIAGVVPVLGRYSSEVSFAFSAAFLAALATSLWLQTRGAGRLINGLAPTAAAIAAAALQFSHRRMFSQDLVVLAGLALITMVAAHLRRGATINSFWRFDLQLGIAVAMGMAALLVVCSGLSLLLESWSYLFGVKLADSANWHIWTTGSALLAPLFALIMMPETVDEPFVAQANSDSVTRAVSYVLNFALVPLVLVYCLTLHIYAAKIAITADMPKGEVGGMVLAFAAIGTITYMMAYPWREIGFRPLRWFMRSWFWLLIVPTAMLTLAAWQRIAEYGVTPERYCLCIFALWLAAIVVYLGATRGRLDLRVIPASLAGVLLLSSFGPWSASAVSVRSQLGQLRQALRKQHLLAGGQLRLNPPRLATFARIVASNQHLRSILTTLDDLDALDRIAPLLAGLQDSPFREVVGGRELRAVLGLYGYRSLSSSEAARSQPPAAVESGGSLALDLAANRYGKLIGPIWINRHGEICPDNAAGSPRSWYYIGNTSFSSSNLVLTAGEGPNVVSFNLASLLQGGKMSPRSPILLPAHEGRQHGLLIVVPHPADAAAAYRSGLEIWLLLAPAHPARNPPAAGAR